MWLGRGPGYARRRPLVGWVSTQLLRSVAQIGGAKTSCDEPDESLGCDRTPESTEPDLDARILILTGDAGESQEIFYAKYRLEEEGWEVHVAAPEKRAILSVVHDFEPGFDTYTEKPGYRVQVDVGIGEVDASAYDALVLPGGRAPEYLRNKAKAVAIVRHFVEAGKPIAANCHGPLLIIAAGGANGKTMTCYPDLEPDLRAAGAEFVNREVVVDGSTSSRSVGGRTTVPGCVSS